MELTIIAVFLTYYIIFKCHCSLQFLSFFQATSSKQPHDFTIFWQSCHQTGTPSIGASPFCSRVSFGGGTWYCVAVRNELAFALLFFLLQVGNG